MLQYGFQRLVLLGSAGYLRAELPLDDSVSLVAPNNIGKTSLINALQFLLIIDRRRMDFGAHDVEKSRRFYFPNNSAYILLEVSLPEVGSMVLGCVGKGVSYDYEYFSYSGSLEIDEYCLSNGNLVSQHELVKHLAEFGRRVSRYSSSSEFADKVYGRRSSKSSIGDEFCLFRLENSSDAAVYQSVLTRTLRLDKLKSSEVKDYLLKIFRRDMPDAGLDFKAIWDDAFVELNAEREQLHAAQKQVKELEHLEELHDKRLLLRGKILHWKPLIDQGIKDWHDYYQQSRDKLRSEQADCEEKIKEYSRDICKKSTDKERVNQRLTLLKNEANELAELKVRFELTLGLQSLKEERKRLQKKRDELKRHQINAQERSVSSVEGSLKECSQKIKTTELEIDNHGNTFYNALFDSLPNEQLTALSRVLAPSVFSLGKDAYELDQQTLIRILNDSNVEQLKLPGLSLKLEGLYEQYQNKNLDELKEHLRDLQHQHKQLNQTLQASREMGVLRQKIKSLENEIEGINSEIQDYQRMEKLIEKQLSRENELASLKERREELKEWIKRGEARFQQLNQKNLELADGLRELERDKNEIQRLSDERIDHHPPFTWLNKTNHTPWLGETDLPPDQLAKNLRTFVEDCNRLNRSDSQIENLVGKLHLRGVTRYQYSSADEEEEVLRLIEFSHNLEREKETLEKKAHTAVNAVSVSLRELRSSLDSVKMRLNEFNRKISGRRLSDLNVFKVEVEDEKNIVEAIDCLISAAASVDRGESFYLFDQESLLEDKKLDRAKTLLIEEGNARGGLRVSDLFRLRFKVGKEGQEPETFDDIDSAASNGTVLMAKLVTGLAMLSLMQDQRRQFKGVCYLDEALSLDAKNQRNLIDIADEFGFSLVFASPEALTTVRYCIPILKRNEMNLISRKSWQILEPLEN